MFPVLWGPFAQGVVERTLLPQLARIDMFTTLSQGRVGRFDVERYNGRWRGGFPDNDNVSSTGVIPIPGWVPTVLPAPEFVPTTLPYNRSSPRAPAASRSSTTPPWSRSPRAAPTR